jgi:hypothetical protein
MAQLKSSLQYKGFYFKENKADSSKTDLFATRRLMYSSFKVLQLEKHIKENFDELYDAGAVDFNIPYHREDESRNIYCDLKPLLLGTFDVSMPSSSFHPTYADIKNIDQTAVMIERSTDFSDYDVGIGYLRFFYKNTLRKENDGNRRVFMQFFEIKFDVCPYEEMRDSLLEHYKSYLALGITSLNKVEGSPMISPLSITTLLGYRSNCICKEQYVEEMPRMRM